MLRASNCASLLCGPSRESKGLKTPIRLALATPKMKPLRAASQHILNHCTLAVLPVPIHRPVRERTSKAPQSLQSRRNHEPCGALKLLQAQARSSSSRFHAGGYSTPPAPGAEGRVKHKQPYTSCSTEAKGTAAGKNLLFQVQPSFRVCAQLWRFNSANTPTCAKLVLEV